MTTKIVPMPPLTTEMIAPVETALPIAGPNRLSDEARLTTTQLVRRADEEAVDRRDAPALVVRREQLHGGVPHDDAHVIHRAADEQHPERKPEPARKPERNRRQPEHGHTPEQRASGFLHRRAVRE